MPSGFFNRHKHDNNTEDDLSSQLSRLTSGADASTAPTSILSNAHSHDSGEDLITKSSPSSSTRDYHQTQHGNGTPGSTCKSKRFTCERSSSSSQGTGDLPHSDTMQSTSSSHSTSSSSGQGTSSTGKTSISGLSALVKNHKDHSHHSRKASQAPEPFILPRDPIALAEAAMSSVVAIPGPPMEQLKKEIWPQLFHIAYEHRVNTRETDLEGLAGFVESFRTRIQSARVRFRSHLMDSDGTATMKRASVALTYDIIATPASPDGKHHSHAEEVRMPVMGVIKIYEGRLAQSDLVIDTLPMHKARSHDQPEVACTLM